MFDELSAPLNLDAVVAGADTPEHAAEIYAASLVAMDADTPAEKAYLQMLAARLGLEPALVDEMHRAATAEPTGSDLVMSGIAEPTMSRLPDLRYEDMTAEQQRVHDEIAAGPRGRVEGPLTRLAARAQARDPRPEARRPCPLRQPAAAGALRARDPGHGGHLARGVRVVRARRAWRARPASRIR